MNDAVNEPKPVDGLPRMLKINGVVLGAATLVLAVSTVVLGGEVLTFAALMFYMNALGIVVNVAAMLVFALTKHWRYAAGALLGALLFALVGFGACLGGAKLLEAVGVASGSFH